LFGLVGRYLPFDDGNLSCFIQKILQEELRYYLSMSAALCDLLLMLLMKDSARRITLSVVIIHP
jgi:hypothetical protein